MAVFACCEERSGVVVASVPAEAKEHLVLRRVRIGRLDPTDRSVYVVADGVGSHREDVLVHPHRSVWDRLA